MTTLEHVKANLDKYNEQLRGKSYDEIIEWAFTLTENRIVTTSFGIYSAVLLSTFYNKDKDIKVIWVDTRYSGDETYAHAREVKERFSLNLHRYESLLSKAETDDLYFSAHDVNEDGHAQFSEAVKLEPFRRALEEHQPALWFTNIRVRQTEYRNKKDILSLSKDGILKVSPFYYWTDEELDAFIEENDLPKNTFYFDPVKAFANRECGIHLQ
ncbi:MAG: phosphoadenosine phosphosulfate reductase family protein [Saprospiraceae bacterium]|nr:phosphoadenosine phosphosulfate reductase family protein [Saprospiraceae bacterium]